MPAFSRESRGPIRSLLDLVFLFTGLRGETSRMNSADKEREIIQKMEKMCGTVPVGTLDLLHILSHPDVIMLTQAYLNEKLGEM